MISITSPDKEVLAVRVQSSIAELFSPRARPELEARLAAYIAPRRWFRSKSRPIASVSLEAVVPLPADGDESSGDESSEVFLTVARVGFSEGPSEDYVLLLTRVRGDSADVISRTKPHLVVGAVHVDDDDETSWLIDGLGYAHALAKLMAFIARGAPAHDHLVEGGRAALSVRTFGPIDGAGEPHMIEAEQSNTSVLYGNRSILKILRRLDDGPSAELEMSECLTRAGFARTPPLLAALELTSRTGEAATVGVVHAFVPNQGDAWSYAVARVAPGGATPDVAFVRPIAELVASMHAVLAAPTSDPRFAAEPLLRAERVERARGVQRSLAAAFAKADAAANGTGDRIAGVRREQGAYTRIVERFVDVDPCWKTRVHGDLHLGQLLVSGDDFVVIDFEGEPARSLAERKEKRSPMVDVAGMVRSLHYACVAGGAGRAAHAWYAQARRTLLESYDASGGRSVLPERRADRETLLQFFCLEKCVYELHYELDNRPDWVEAPIEGLEELSRESARESSRESAQEADAR
jgi:predicted trehalose synthase